MLMRIHQASPTGLLLLGLAGSLGVSATAAADTPRLVTQTMNDIQTVTLPGNTRPEATEANDRGPVADNLQLDHMQLLLKRPAETEAALVRYIDALHNPASPSFHKFLTAATFGAVFGPVASDVAAVKSWLQAKGFVVNGVVTGGMVIDFSGTAGQVRSAFGTEIHNLDVNGVAHIANMTDPTIPAALAGVVHGVVSLHDFRPHTNFKVNTATAVKPAYTVGGGYELVVPGDLAKIYRLAPLFRKGITGQGVTIALIEDTDVYSAADWTKFRSTFGLSITPWEKRNMARPATVRAIPRWVTPYLCPTFSVT